ncbi:MAG: hypothetical protein ACRC2R_27170 [Xenococcaceae cyanobacterium]
MNRFISTLAISSLTTVASIFSLSLSVSAAPTVNNGQVQMKATIGNMCLFDNATDGQLGADPNNLDTLSSALPANGITLLPGSAGSIEVTCNNAASTINISSVTETNTASATIDTFTTTVTGLGSPITSVDGAAGTAVAVNSTNTETLDVDLDATYQSNLTPGDYTFTVNIVATP